MSRVQPRAQSRRVVGNWKGRQVEFCNDRLVVSVREGHSLEATLDEISRIIQAGVDVKARTEPVEGARWAVIRFSAPLSADQILELAARIAADKRILYAEPSFIGHGSFEPTGEVYWEKQKVWARAIDLPGAWDHTFGSSDVLLAIIDSGISIETGNDPDHPDLDQARYIVRNGTIKQDYVDNDDVPQDTHEVGHGTHVTGIASAPGDNTDGIAGVNWVSDVYIAKVLDSNDDFTTDALLQAVKDLIAYATTAGKKMVVVNLSLHVYADAGQITDMFDMFEAGKAFGGKILFCCAAEVAGLSRTEVDYPAAYASDYDFIITVGGSDGTEDPADDEIAEPLGLDNYDAVDIFAPGVAIWSTLPTYKRSHGTTAANNVDYGEVSGSSMATPMVAGVASLMWGLNNDLTAAQLIACMKTMADEIKYTRITRDAGGGIVSEVETTHRRLNASGAVLAALWNIELTDNHIEFSDVAVGVPDTKEVVFDVECAHELTFEVIEDKLPHATLVVTPSGTYTSGTQFRGIKVTYTPAAAGDVSYGQFRIQCKETEQEWDLYVTASAVPAESVAAVLVADRSGSMAELSGIGTMTRMDVLKEAAGILVDKMRVDDGLGVVGFSSNVDEPSPFATIAVGTNRDSIKNDIATMSPGGGTCIGGGVEKGDAVLSGATQPRRAILLLTDGQENTAPFVAEVMSSVDVPVYAIGMGTAEVLQPAALELLASMTGGSLVLTDMLDDQRRYVVAKYILQMLAGAIGDEVILDPAGMLRPRQVVTVPFQLCEDDRDCEVTLLVANPRLVRMQVKTPKDNEVTSGALKAGSRMMSRRFALPVEHEHAGPWSVTLELAGEESEEALRRDAEATKSRIPSMRYALMVTTKSSIRMRCNIYRTTSTPGATITVRATVTRRGLPYDGHVLVHAQIQSRDQVDAKPFELERTNDGSFEGRFVASSSGVYECLVRASGVAPRGQRFRREQALTAHIWEPQQHVDLDRARMRERDQGES